MYLEARREERYSALRILRMYDPGLTRTTTVVQATFLADGLCSTRHALPRRILQSNIRPGPILGHADQPLH